ncbi:MAG: hypothetical protein RIT81_17905 [Deltaproteobacteria bacterium]
MRALMLLSTVGLFALGACAPLQNQTHYERWDAYAAAHPEDMEEEDGPEAAPKDMKKAPAAKPAPKKPAPPPPAAPADYSSLGSGTPAISGTQTATKSRVVAPEPEDEPLY